MSKLFTRPLFVHLDQKQIILNTPNVKDDMYESIHLSDL